MAERVRVGLLGGRNKQNALRDLSKVSKKKELFRSCIVMSDFLGKVVWWFGLARHTLHSSEWTSELRRKFPALNEQLKA